MKTIPLAKAEAVKIIEYVNMIEDFECRFAVLDDVFRFFAGKGKHCDVPRNGEDFPDLKTLRALSSPHATTRVFNEDNVTHAYTETHLSWSDFCTKYQSPPKR